jgi:3D (Asp-Asp-Asp) domain-containing protein
MKLIALAAILNIFQLSVATAPIDAIIPNVEQSTEATSLVAESPFEAKHRTMTVTLTAYSSTPDQTDDTPFVTAMNTPVREGVVAANFLPFGTKIKIPKLFGEKVFVVEDRMNKRYSDPKNPYLDIWYPDRELALRFGVRTATVVVLES